MILLILFALALFVWGLIACIRGASGEIRAASAGVPFLLIGGMILLAACFPASIEALSKIWRRVDPGAAANLILFIAAFFAFIYFNIRLTAARLRRWAAENGLEYRGHRTASRSRSPWGWSSSRYQHTYEVSLSEDGGEPRTAFIRMGSFWGMNPGAVEFVWADDGEGGAGAALKEAEARRAEQRAKAPDPRDLMKPRW